MLNWLWRIHKSRLSRLRRPAQVNRGVHMHGQKLAHRRKRTRYDGTEGGVTTLVGQDSKKRVKKRKTCVGLALFHSMPSYAETSYLYPSQGSPLGNYPILYVAVVAPSPLLCDDLPLCIPLPLLPIPVQPESFACGVVASRCSCYSEISAANGTFEVKRRCPDLASPELVIGW